MDQSELDFSVFQILCDAYFVIDSRLELPEKLLQAIRNIRQHGLNNQDNPAIICSAFLAQSYLLKLLVSEICREILL